MEIKKEYYFLILIILIGIIFVGLKQNWFSSLEESKTAVFPSERAEMFGVSSSSGLPAFAEQLIIDPYNVSEGEKQVFSIWANDEQGIENVKGEVYTDNGVESFDLSLLEGDKKMGRWQGEWMVKDLDLQDSYSFSLTAVSEEGKSTRMTPSFEVSR